jgi:hypothetical protein
MAVWAAAFAGETLRAFSDRARAVLAHQGDGLSTATRNYVSEARMTA